MRGIFILSFILLSYFGQAQDARQILQQSFEKCQTVQNGHYRAVIQFKPMGGEDTLARMHDTHFKKIENDPNFDVLFHTKCYHKGIYSGDIIYTGNEFVRTSIKDSVATVMSRSHWEEVLSSRELTTDAFYHPFTSKKRNPLFDMSDKDVQLMTFKLIGEEQVNGKDCYYIEGIDLEKDDLDQILQTLHVKYGYWIDKEEMIPLQYTIHSDMLMHSDSLVQFIKCFLKSYEVNNLEDESILTMDAIPAFYTIRDYVQDKPPDPLSRNSKAPDWILPALNDEYMHLSDLKGKVVLVDFFYKSCYPCLLALPGLQSLHEKYQDKGLVVVGINPVDGEESGLSEFMAKRGVTYPVLLADDGLAEKYKVNAYPTMFLLDRSGKIVFIQSGYGPNMEKELEREIKKLL